jgi:hypothetical protein
LFAVQSAITLGTLLFSTSAAPWARQSVLAAVGTVAALGCVVGLVARWRWFTLSLASVLTLDLVRTLLLGGPSGWTVLRGEVSLDVLIPPLLPLIGALAVTWWLVATDHWWPDRASLHERALAVVAPVWLAAGPLLVIGAFSVFDLNAPTCIGLVSVLALVYAVGLALPALGTVSTRWEWSMGSLVILALSLPAGIVDFLQHDDESGNGPNNTLLAIETLLFLLVAALVVINRQKAGRAGGPVDPTGPAAVGLRPAGPARATALGLVAIIVTALELAGITLYFPSQQPQQLRLWVTGYSWQDNTPPGSAAVSHPIVHKTASGTGTYADPITVAVAGDRDHMTDPPGTRFYLPTLKRYVIVEDSGASPIPPGDDTHLDTWIDGRDGTKDDTDDCENQITGQKVPAEINPPANLPVTPGTIYANHTCNAAQLPDDDQ